MTHHALDQPTPSSEVGYLTGPTTLGVVLVAKSERGIRAILLGDTNDEVIEELLRQVPNAKHDPGLAELLGKAVALVETPDQGLTEPLDMRATPFQKRVWRALQKIPAGHTASYKTIAQRIGEPKSARAVAQACRTNLLAVAAPCHRVVRSDGALSGYRWARWRKQALLEREQAIMGSDRAPG